MIINNKIYALYKGEDNIADGTISEIAKKVGKTRGAIATYKTPTYKSRKHVNSYELVELELEDENDSKEEKGRL